MNSQCSPDCSSSLSSSSFPFPSSSDDSEGLVVVVIEAKIKPVNKEAKELYFCALFDFWC